jgi:hypothetical protein
MVGRAPIAAFVGFFDLVCILLPIADFRDLCWTSDKLQQLSGVEGAPLISH